MVTSISDLQFRSRIRHRDTEQTGGGLHYALDLCADQWRKRQTRGDVIIVRYADDFVVRLPA